MPEFNLNNKVRVKLTDAGRAALKRDHALFWSAQGCTMPYLPPKEDADGWSEWQLWSLMSALGNLVFSNVMETSIQIEPFNVQTKPTRSGRP
jgi:hypothetical protein